MNIVCLKWGDKYPYQYVNNLYRSVVRRTEEDITFYCITDDGRRLDDEIVVVPFPKIELEGWWWKLTLFNPEFYPQIKGETLYLDLDVVLTASIQPYLDRERKADLLTIKNFGKDGDMNSSVLRWDRNELGWIWEKFLTTKHVGRPKRYYEYLGKVLQGDQNFLDMVVDREYFPERWTRSYKYSGECECIKKAPRIVVFHGKPDPHEVTCEWVKSSWG